MTGMTVERVLLAEPRGFCAGVEMAIKALTWMTRIFDGPVYCYHEIVHNEWVVRAFEGVGVVFVNDIQDVPLRGAGDALGPRFRAGCGGGRAADRAAVVIDAVCPLVTKVHHEVKRMARDGYEIIYVGHTGHDEAVGTVAEAPAAITLVEPETGLGEFQPVNSRKGGAAGADHARSPRMDGGHGRCSRSLSRAAHGPQIGPVLRDDQSPGCRQRAHRVL